MLVEPSYSETSVEAMFVRGLGPRLTPDVRAELKALGVDLDGPLRAAYPQLAWESALARAVTAVFPTLSAEQGHFEAGRAYMQGFTNTLLGAAVVQLGRLIGPERTLSRMQRNQRTTNNYSVLQIEKLGPTHFVLHASCEPSCLPGIRPVPGGHISGFVTGVYFEVLNLLAVRNPKVTSRAINADELRFDYDLSWDP